MMIDGLAPARRRLVLAIMGALVVVALAVAGVAIFRSQSAADPVSQETLGPVILVAGYGGNTDVLQPLADTLRDDGRVVEIFPPVGNNTGDLAEQAVALGTFIDRVRRDISAPSVDVIGYSAGGVVARLWARDLGEDGVARRVVTLASPHHGTGVSSLATEAGGCPRACEQLRPDSDLLRRLNAGDETPDGPEWVTFRTEDDETVTPSTSADLEGALNLTVQQYCPSATMSHGQLPTSALVLGAMPQMLGDSTPAAPASGEVDCS